MVLKLNLNDVHLKQVQKKTGDSNAKATSATQPKDDDRLSAIKTNPLAAMLAKPSAGKTPSTSTGTAQANRVIEKPVEKKVVVADNHILQPPPVVSRLIESESTELVKTVVVDGEPMEQLVINFQKRLDDLDRLIQADANLSAFSIDQAKGYVKQIMIDLNEHGELDSCVIDRDVHNIVAFIRSVKSIAADSQVVTKAKKEKKEKKAKITDGFVLALPGAGEPFKLDLTSFSKMKT